MVSASSLFKSGSSPQRTLHPPFLFRAWRKLLILFFSPKERDGISFLFSPGMIITQGETGESDREHHSGLSTSLRPDIAGSRVKGGIFDFSFLVSRRLFPTKQ
jgi:hypothetical protein